MEGIAVPAPPARRPRVWLVAACALVALTCALVPCSSLLGLGAPAWVAVVAALAVFPVLPLLWHLLAVGGILSGQSARFAPLELLALRTLAVALVVLAVSLSNLGPRRLAAGLWSFVHPDGADKATPRGRASPTRQVRGGSEPGAPAHHPLESFIPADATLAVGLSDAAIMQQLVVAGGVDAPRRLAALEKCQIVLHKALVLIAVRDHDTHLVVVRAPGITDSRNLYCLVGFLGGDDIKVRIDGDKAPLRFVVEGLVSHPLKFEAIDAQTVAAADGGWQNVLATRPAAPPSTAPEEGPLVAVMDRIDRSASLWSVSVTETDKGRWDLAVDAHIDGTQLQLRGSSIPPSGEADKAEAQLHVPLAFASALPAGALGNGIRGLAAVIAATGARLTPGPPAPPSPRLTSSGTDAARAPR